jgi:predicted methyltransferase
MQSRARSPLLFVLAALLGACASPPAPTPAPPEATPAPSRDEPTAAAIELALAGAHRSPENRARDAQRHPLETLLFFGIKPDMYVIEISPGAGWYTEILAPLLSDNGKFVVLQPAASDNPYVERLQKAYADKLAALPATYGKVTIATLPAHYTVENTTPPGSGADMVVTMLDLHAWLNLGKAQEFIARMRDQLKPGGILGVVDHRGVPARTPDPRATNGYVNEDYAIALITAAGFELVARSEVNANPKDTKDYAQGVWTLPPDYRMGNRDRAKYEAIGESDRFTLKFRKP